MKKGLFLTVMLVSALALSHTQNASWTVTNTATWVEAVNGIRSGGNNKEYAITVVGTVSVPMSNDNTFGSVTGITVTMEGNGILSLSSSGSLLRIGISQTIVIRNLTLRGRSENNSSVVRIGNGGIFFMGGNAKVIGNTVTDEGGGVYVEKGGTFTMRDSASVSGNTANKTRWGRYSNAEYSVVAGGGVYNDGTFSMQNNSSVSGNIGCGVYNGGIFTMQDTASVVGNNSRNGGGVYNYGTFTMEGNVSVSGNTTNYGGGGVHVGHGSFIMRENASIFGNTAGNGGGVCVEEGGTFTMQGGSISDNTASGGGAVYVQEGTFIMQGGMLSKNTANNIGGAVYAYGGTITMQGGLISENTANGHGGGVYADGGTGGAFNMQGGTISNNIAKSYGGGAYIGSHSHNQYHYGNRTFTMQGNASVIGNIASFGGGVFIGWDGTFIIKDNASVSGNTSTYRGGGVYFNDGTFTKIGGTIYGDDAEHNLKNTVISRLGHAVYNARDGAWRNASAGPTMNSDSYGFWLNDGDVVIFPSGFAGDWKRSNYNNTLYIGKNTIESSSSNYLWILQSISGNAYTFKRSDAANTLTITIRLDGNSLVISGDSGNGQDNWNGTWRKQ